MTDHGGAASPRTATQALIDENRRLIEERDRLRAAQEAPAPEGLRRDALIDALAYALDPNAYNHRDDREHKDGHDAQEWRRIYEGTVQRAEGMVDVMLERLAAQEAPAPEGLRAALEASGFEPESNVCRACGHDGGQHDLRNWCLVCPRPEVEIGPTDHSVDKRVAAGWCFFSSMSEDERWEHSVKRLRAALATPPTPADPPNLDYESEWYRKGWEAGRAATIADHILAQEAPAPEGLRAAAQAVLDELDIIRRTSSDPATYPRLMVHIDTHNDLRRALEREADR